MVLLQEVFPEREIFLGFMSDFVENSQSGNMAEESRFHRLLQQMTQEQAMLVNPNSGRKHQTQYQ